MQRLIISTFLFFFSFVLFGQSETLLVQGIEKNIEIKYAAENKFDPSSRIIELLARAKSLPVKATTLTYNVKEHQKIEKINNNLQLQLSIGNFVFDDDPSYQKFSIKSFLTPSIISYTYIWADENNNIIKTETISKKSFKNGSFLLKENVVNTFSSNVFKLYLSDVSFGFTDDDVKKLEAFMALVDGYYNADARLSLMEQELGKVRKDSIEMLETYRQQSIDNIKVLNQIRSERYASKLDLDLNDPIHFKSHFGRVEVLNRNSKVEIEKTIDNMYVTYYLKGKDWLNWNDKIKAKSFFQKSIAEKSNYPPPHFELAQLNFDEKNYAASIDSCSMILTKLKPDTDTRYNAVKLAESVIYVYINEINTNIEKGDFVQAMEQLVVCENYSKSIPGVKYFEEFNTIHGKLYKAYYSDLVNITSNQIEAKQLKEAHFNVDSLAQFRSLHSTYIQSPEQEHVLLMRLYAAWVEAGKTFINNSAPDSALYAFTQASILCNKYEVVSCTDELIPLMQQARVAQYKNMAVLSEKLIQEQWADSAIALLNEADIFCKQNNLEKNDRIDSLYLKAQQLKYVELIRSGDLAYEENKSREALAFYDEALSIEKTYRIEPDTALSDKIVLAAHQNIVLFCIQGETFVEAMRIDDAMLKLQAAKNIYTYYKLEQNEESTVAIAALQEKLQTGKCEKVQYDYNIQLIASKKFIEQKEFIYAWQALEKSNTISRTNSDCNVADSVNKRLSNEIRPMLFYQKQMIQIKEQLNKEEFRTVIEDYVSLSKFYTDSCKNNFGVSHQNLYNFIVTNTNSGLIDYSVRYYSEMGKTDTALVLLNELCSRKYIASWSKESQILVGTQLAILDRETESETPIDPKVKVFDYTKYNKWYNYLKKAYLQQWKIQ